MSIKNLSLELDSLKKDNELTIESLTKSIKALKPVKQEKLLNSLRDIDSIPIVFSTTVPQ